MKTETYPISKYVGTFPKGTWVFVKDFVGSLEECYKECVRLQELDTKKGKKATLYRCWDNR